MVVIMSGKILAACAVWFAVLTPLGCKTETTLGTTSASSSSTHVVLRLSNTAAIVEGKTGTRTFKIANPQLSKQQARALLDHIYAEGGKEGAVWIWGRYDAPKVYDSIADELSDVPTRLCLRDGSNCRI